LRERHREHIPRSQRDIAPGLHHVIVKAAGPDAYFRDDVDRMAWIRRFVKTLDRHIWTCVIFCQMTTHVHTLVDVPDTSLPRGMQYLNSWYGQEFNARHRRSGYLIGNRFWSTRLKTTSQVLTAFRYVARNAEDAGLCESPEDWFWGSYGTTIAAVDRFPFVDATLVLSQFGPSRGAAIAALRDFVGRS
jgi:putative transposase